MRSFCKSYSEIKTEATRGNELSSVEKKIDNLKNEARGYEEKGAGRQADNQAAVLASLLGLPPIKVEQDLTLFLAVLVEVGAALGLYFATGHIRSDGPGGPGRSRGVTIVEARVLKDVSEAKQPRASLKQIAGPTAAPAGCRV